MSVREQIEKALEVASGSRLNSDAATVHLLLTEALAGLEDMELDREAMERMRRYASAKRTWYWDSGEGLTLLPEWAVIEGKLKGYLGQQHTWHTHAEGVR